VALWSLGTCPEGEQGAMVSSCPFSKLSGGLFEWFSDIFSCHDRLLPPEIQPNWNLQNHEPSQPFPLYRLITSGVSLQSLFSPELLQLWEDSFASLGFLKSPHSLFWGYTSWFQLLYFYHEASLLSKSCSSVLWACFIVPTCWHQFSLDAMSLC
jgi:hypothetical protein